MPMRKGKGDSDRHGDIVAAVIDRELQKQAPRSARGSSNSARRMLRRSCALAQPRWICYIKDDVEKRVIQ